MTVDVRLRPEAEQDLAEAARWFEEQRPGLGQEFLDEALATFTAIAERPLARSVKLPPTWSENEIPMSMSAARVGILRR